MTSITVKLIKIICIEIAWLFVTRSSGERLADDVIAVANPSRVRVLRILREGAWPQTYGQSKTIRTSKYSRRLQHGSDYLQRLDILRGVRSFKIIVHNYFRVRASIKFSQGRL